MDTLQCAIVLAKLPRFAWEVAQRETLGARYTALIHERVPGAKTVETRDVGQPLSGIRTLALEPDRTSVYAQYTVLVPRREEMQAKLQEAGIPTAVHYPVPLNQQPAYKGLGSDAATPISEWAAQHVMSLPMGPDLSESDQQKVVDALVAAVA
jgi:UDP-2-acetamido-2-deoxy-ribo-hexuluronate aminotransferase